MTPEMRAMIKQTVTESPHFDSDSQYFFDQLKDTFSWFQSLSDIRQVALIALCFLIGWKNVLSLSNLIFYLANFNYLGAAEELSKLGHTSIAAILATDTIQSK